MVLTDRAARELEDSARWWAVNRSPRQAATWNSRFVAALRHIGNRPERYPPVRESKKFAIELRQLNFGAGKRKTHRAVFTQRSGAVFILTIRHLSQDELGAEDIQ